MSGRVSATRVVLDAQSGAAAYSRVRVAHTRGRRLVTTAFFSASTCGECGDLTLITTEMQFLIINPPCLNALVPQLAPLLNL